MIVELVDIEKSFGTDTVLKNINFSVNEGDRIGLLGVNGAGKSTLLNIITGSIDYDRGRRFVSSDIEIGYLKQNNSFLTDNTIEEEIKTVFADLYEIETKLNVMRMNGVFDKEYDRLNTIFEGFDGYNLETKINVILNGIGFKDYDRAMPVSKLSGGEKNRLAFAKLLLKEPKLLILDEPTNHLDFEALNWLEGYLQSYKGAILIVSHDRYFLDKIAKDICEIEDGEITRYKGGYSSFIKQKEERIALYQKEYDKQQKEIEKMKDFVAKNLTKSASVNSVGSRVKALEKMEVMAKPKVVRKKIALNFNYDIEPHKNVFSGEKITIKVGAGEAQKTLTEDVSFSIIKGEKIAVIGLNGVGKSSFIKGILGRIPCGGRLKWGENVRISYFEQENEQLNRNNTIMEEVHNRFPLKTENEIRSTLAMLLITGDDIYKKICELSGGERAKVAFAIIMLEKPNLLVLDEPTNHLDYEAKEVLEDALMKYKGTILMISHDRYMLNKVPTKIVEMKPNDFVSYDGGYDYYVEHRKVDKPVATKKEVSNSGNQYYRSKEQRAYEQKLKNIKNNLEKEILKLEEEITSINEEMSKPEVVSDYVRLNELCTMLNEKQKELDSKMQEWLN